MGVDDLEGRSDGTELRVRELETEVDEILDRLHEIDKSWQNNLVRIGTSSSTNNRCYSAAIYACLCTKLAQVFYGLKADSYEEPPEVTEHKIRELILRRMQISRQAEESSSQSYQKSHLRTIF